MEIIEKLPEKICKFAQKFERRRGDAILCFKNHTKKEMLIFINFPDKISNIPYCIATHEFSTGHSTPDCLTNLNEMYECSARIERK